MSPWKTLSRSRRHGCAMTGGMACRKLRYSEMKLGHPVAGEAARMSCVPNTRNPATAVAAMQIQLTIPTSVPMPQGSPARMVYSPPLVRACRPCYRLMQHERRSHQTDRDAGGGSRKAAHLRYYL